MNVRFTAPALTVVLALGCCAASISCSSTAKKDNESPTPQLAESGMRPRTETTVRGKAENDEVLDACVSTAEGLAIYIKGLHAWPVGILGKDIVATGAVSRQSHDTLVPIDKPLEKILRGEQAIDTHVTAGFLVLEDAKWKLVSEDE